MELNQLESLTEVSDAHLESLTELSDSSLPEIEINECISIETEIPEALYQGMKEFIGDNPNWDQYSVMSSALANFLFQSGCDDRSVTERYLNDLFKLSNP